MEAVIVSDDQGLILAGEKSRNIDIELVSFLTAIVNPILDRIRNEFEFKKFGTASFDTEDHRLLFISIDESTTLSLVMMAMGSIDKIAPFAYLLAEKVAQILSEESIDENQLILPNLVHESSRGDFMKYLRNQIYKKDLSTGYNFQFKFIILGDHQVGKTSIIRRFIEKRFQQDYRTTIGLNVLSHDFEVFGNRINILLWDIGAQEYFKRFRKTYYNGTQAAFVVFDTTSRKSFENVKTWYNELMEFAQNKDLPIIIIGNKIDLKEQREVSFEEGANLAKELSELATFSIKSDLTPFSDLSRFSKGTKTRISFIETSALTGENIHEAFTFLSYHFIQRFEELENKRLRSLIKENINIILEDKGELILTFLNKDLAWSPGLQLFTELFPINDKTLIKEKKNKKIIKYPFGLVLESQDFYSFKITDSDGILCIFDARENVQDISELKEILHKLFNKIKKNKVISIGFRVASDTTYSDLIHQLELDEELEEKDFSIFLFQLSDDFKLEIFRQVQTMIEYIKNLRFAY